MVVAANNKSVALALGSGGARGYAHIGVLRAIHERDYTVAAISGCSMGALIGGVYAAGKMDEFTQWVLGLDHFDILRLLDLSFSSNGAIRGERVFSVLDELIGDQTIEDLPLAYTAVAADLNSQREIWFQEGSLKKAIRASVAIPSVLPPVTMGEKLLVDGGLLNPLPIAPTISSHADFVVAVNLSWLDGKSVSMSADSEESAEQLISLESKEERYDDWLDRVKQSAIRFFERSKESSGIGEHQLDAEKNGKSKINGNQTVGVLDIINMSFETMQGALTQYKLAGYPPDVLINVPKRVCKTFEYHKANELITLGYELANEALDEFEQS